MAMSCRPMRRLEQSRERLDNLRAQIDSDVATALLNLQSSADQVNVARSNIDFGRRDAGAVARSLQRGRHRYRGGGAIARGGRERARTVHIESLQLQFRENFLGSRSGRRAKRASRNISKENKHGGREPSPFGA